MKTNSLIIIIAIIITFQSHAQTLNHEVADEGETPFLLGKIDKNGLQGENYKAWFIKNYEAYKPNLTIVETIASALKGYTITIFLGTWCGDSKQEVPKFYKVLEACNFPLDQLSVIAVSRKPNMYKQSPQHEEAGLNIHRVPTFIFYINGKEINRIVEHPIETFEQDIQNIIIENKYRSNYQIVTAIDNILKKKGLKGLKRKQKNLLKKYNNKVSSMFELNTYGRILYGTNCIEEAIEVFKINTKLFPNEPRTYMSLANTLGISGNKSEAINVLEKALKLFPDSSDLKENLEVIKSK